MDEAKREGQSIFNIMTGIAIILLIKNPQHQGNCQLFYHDIGDYLTRQQKLDKIREFAHIQNIPWQRLMPNTSHDWINQRNTEFASFLVMGDKKDDTEKTIFDVYSNGLKTNRDTWAYNFSKAELTHNMSRMIAFFNEQVTAYHSLPKDERLEVDQFVDLDPEKISWTRALKQDLTRNKQGIFDKTNLVRSMYRPFCKQWLYFDRQFNEMVLQMPKIFPNETVENVVICVPGLGARRDFSVFISNTLPDLNIFESASQCFPLYTYEKLTTDGLFAATGEYVRKDNINNLILNDFQRHYADSTINKLAIFHYIYGLLHVPSYKTRYAADLKKMLPRIPLAPNFWPLSHAGRDLAQWHLNYETIEPCPLQETTKNLPLDPKTFYRVQKMQFPKNGKTADKTTLIYNNNLTLTGIPLETYDYIVNGKSALDWIIERYQITVDKDSGLKNDPNDWSDNPRYIVDLIKRIVRVSVETVKIVKTLPEI